MTEHLPCWKSKSPLIISPFLLSSCCCCLNCKRWQLFPTVIPLAPHSPIMSCSSLLLLKSCHLPPMLFFISDAPQRHISLQIPQTHRFRADVVKMINCGISNLHFNILFTLLLKSWSDAISVILEWKKEQVSRYYQTAILTKFKRANVWYLLHYSLSWFHILLFSALQALMFMYEKH